MKTIAATAIPCLLLAAAWLGAPAPAGAASTFHPTSLVPHEADTAPTFSTPGSSLKLISGNGRLKVKGKLKRVVDASGDRITTDRSDPDDDYAIEIDLSVPATGATETVAIAFDLKNGNATFRTDVKRNAPLFDGAEKGDAVIVDAVRIFEPTGALIGVGGVALRR
jgi:hypothetical protein